MWWDRKIVPGQEFDRLIDVELAAAGVVLVAWTATSVESRWVRGEARDGADRGILVPVRFDGATVPLDLRAFQAIDFDDAALREDSPQIQQMLDAIGALVEAVDRPERRKSTPARLPKLPDIHPDRVAICVLPFANLSGVQEQQYFSDGISEDIITELSRWQMLAVRSRGASFRYRGGSVDTQQVARELDVRFIVEGSVRRMGDRTRISAQLVDAETTNQVWAEKFDCDNADIFTVQDQVVRTIVSTLVGRAQARGAERASRKPSTTTLAAYECVLKGNALPWDEPDGAAEATRLFEKAIEIDPGYGLAHALLAAMRYGQWYEDPVGTDDRLQEANLLSMRAVDLDPNESTCHSILAQVCHLQGRFDLCMHHIRRAVELNPTNQWNQADMGMMLVYAGHSEEALSWFKRARQIDPYFDPPWYWREFGLAYLLLHRHDEAREVFDHLHVRQYRIAAFKAACHALLGEAGLAREWVRECLEILPAFSTRHCMAKLPFRNVADSELLGGAMRQAGLPE